MTPNDDVASSLRLLKCEVDAKVGHDGIKYLVVDRAREIQERTGTERQQTRDDVILVIFENFVFVKFLAKFQFLYKPTGKARVKRCNYRMFRPQGLYQQNLHIFIFTYFYFSLFCLFCSYSVCFAQQNISVTKRIVTQKTVD